MSNMSNKYVNGDSGLVALIEDEDKLMGWTICSPKISKAVAEFEKGLFCKPKTTPFFITMKILIALRPDLASIFMILQQNLSCSVTHFFQMKLLN